MRTVHKLQAALVALLWGVNFVVIAMGLRDFTPLVLTALRFAAVAVPLVFFVRRPSAKVRHVVAYGVSLGVLNFGLLFTAIRLGMPAGLASLVVQAQALVSVLLAATVLRERIAPTQWAGVLVGSAGIAVLALGRGGRASLVGFALTLAAAASWSLANVVARVSGETRPLSLLVWSSLVPPLPLLGIALAVDGVSTVEHSLTGVTLRGVLVVAFAYPSTLFGFAGWNRLMGVYSVGRVAPFSLLVPVFGLGSAWLFLDEPIGGAELLAAAVVVGGLALVTRRSTRPAAVAVAEP